MSAVNPQRFNMIPRGLPNPEANGLYVRFEDWQAMHDVAKTSLSDQLKLEAEAQALREEVARLEAHCERFRTAGVESGAEIGRLHEEVAALRARVVVPERKELPDQMTFPGGPAYFAKELDKAVSWNACLNELARLNGKAVSEGLLRRVCLEAPAVQDMHEQSSWELAHFKAVEELRALLDEGKEVGDV